MELIDYCRYYMIPIIITAVWLCLSVAFFFWKKNRGCAPAIFVFGGMALLAFVWPHWTTNIGDYKAEVLDRVNQEEWQSLDPQLRLRLNDVVKLTQPLYNNSDTVINLYGTSVLDTGAKGMRLGNNGKATINIYDSAQYFQRALVKEGVYDALKEAGIKDGDEVRIDDFVFEWFD